MGTVFCSRCGETNDTSVPRCIRCDAILANLAETVDADVATEAAVLSTGLVRLGEIILGKYRVEQLLGRGGMGVVYLAHDTYIDRKVALKVIRFDVDISGARRLELAERLAREARTASAVMHPNVVIIYDAGEWHDVNYVVMEFVAGVSADVQLAASGPLDRYRALEVTLQVAAGLGAAHAAGVVHRDVKPSNILLATNGQVKLTDFGIAKVLQEAIPITSTGATVGTPAYMSPEQIRCEAVDHRSDLFSLATVLYEMISGKRPFHGDSPHALFYQVLETARVDLSFVPEQLRDQYDAFFSRGLAKQKEGRFSSAAELGRAVQGLMRLERPAAVGPDMSIFATPKLPPRLDETAGNGVPAVPSGASLPESPRMSGLSRQGWLPPAGARRWPLRIALAAIGVSAVVFGLFGTRLQSRVTPLPTAVPTQTSAPTPPAPASTPTAIVVMTLPVRTEPSPELLATATSSATPAAPTATATAPPLSPTPAALLPTATQAAVVPTHPPALPSGRLELTVRPWAEVYLDGKRLGYSPVPTLALTAGPHVLRLVNPTLAVDIVRNVSVPSGDTRALTIELTKGWLRIRVQPAAEIIVDGVSMGLAADTSLELRTGPHEVVLRQEGYESWTGKVEVLSQVEVEVPIALRHAIKQEPTPEGASSERDR
ncbi:MAG: serine/threonine protein kinase [Candidatus Schekmanbacteria bacterium]|nr:serine/threonine protein kinase [Candidatus Schekmanbacteria bacterium]